MAILRSNLTLLALKAPHLASEALLQTGKDIYEISQQLVPVDTSSLKRSGGAEAVDAHTVQVGYGVEGVFIAGRDPFAQSRETFKKRLNDAIEKEAKADAIRI